MNIDIEGLKRQAKRIARATAVTHAQALDVLAVQRGHSHWGSLLKASLAGGGARDDEPKTSSTVRRDLARRLAEEATGRTLPELEGCRHLIVAGGTSTGKTSMLQKLVDRIGDRTSMLIDDIGGIRMPCSSITRLHSRTGDPFAGRKLIEEALEAPPVVLVVGEMDTLNTATLLDAMERDDGPTILTTLHALDRGDVAYAVAARTRGWGHTRSAPPKGIAVIGLVRRSDGERGIGWITAA